MDGRLTLFDLRKRLGMSRAQIAALAGCSYSTVHKIETGERSEPPALRPNLAAQLRHLADEVEHSTRPSRAE